ncbi:MAG: hypothetical protein ACREQ5_00655 [Candidatus Dormibacteria bacterium]
MKITTDMQARKPHPFEDEFTHEWAWTFEDAFNRFAAVSPDVENFKARIMDAGEEIAAYNPDISAAWARFIVRKATS